MSDSGSTSPTPTSPNQPPRAKMPSSTGSSQPGSPDSCGSPPSSPRGSFVTTPVPRRLSLQLPADVLQQMQRRRSSLEKLHVEKITPWMHLYDFTEEEKLEQEKETSD